MPAAVSEADQTARWRWRSLVWSARLALTLQALCEVPVFVLLLLLRRHLGATIPARFDKRLVVQGCDQAVCLFHTEHPNMLRSKLS